MKFLRLSFNAVLAASFALAMNGCKTIKPYEKEYLLSPLMDDGAIARTDNKFGRESCGSFEKLAGLGGGGGASACPTCGI